MKRASSRASFGLTACLLAAAAAAAALAGCDAAADVAPVPPKIRLGVGSRGGDFYVMGRALAETLRSGQPGYTVEIVSNEGAVSILNSLQQGKSDCGFSYANVAYEGYVGRLVDEPTPLTSLRGVALVEITPLHFIVRRGASIGGVRDLRGRSIVIGPRGSGSYRAALLVLEAYGVDINAIDVHVEPFRNIWSRMKDGTIDGHFVIIARLADSANDVLANGDAEILPLEGPAIDALRDRYPFLHPVVIPANTYPSQPAAVRTVGVESLLLCRDDVAPEHVRRLTGDWFITLTNLAREGRVTEAVNATLASATPIPLHPGAAEFYRARQVQLR